jgi:hypothetical protein
VKNIGHKWLQFSNLRGKSKPNDLPPAKQSLKRLQ